MNTEQIQYVSNTQGKTSAVIVPIELWQEIISEQETAYLLKSEAMKQRLLAAKMRKDIDGKTLSLSMPNIGENEDFARHQDSGQKHEKLLSFLKKHRVKVDCISIPNREERNAR